MPYSDFVFDREVEGLIESMLPRSVLDIGPGAGKYGKMIQGLRSRGVDIPHLAAIEIDASYVEQFELNGIYDVVQVGDATSLPDIGPDACWDLVILGDVLEHFRKSRGVVLLDYCGEKGGRQPALVTFRIAARLRRPGRGSTGQFFLGEMRLR
jgi:SAM-dependent methyltransferase